MTDLYIALNSNLESFSFGLEQKNTDLRSDDGIRAALFYSLFTDRRADTDDIIPDGSDDKRGYWGDSLLKEGDVSEGSKLWLLKRSIQSQGTLNKAIEYVRESVRWMIDDSIISKINVNAEFIRLGVLGMQLELFIINGERFSETIEVII